jgi:hypothetical protein
MDNSELKNETAMEAESAPASRPVRVTIMGIGVLIITIINLTRQVLSIMYWDFLENWPGVSPLYMMITGFVWTLTGSILLWGLWTAKSWAPRLMRAVVLAYALYYWLDHIFLIDHSASGAVGIQRALLPVNWQFAAGATVICLAFTAWTLEQSKVKAYFGVSELVIKDDPLKENNQ